MHTRSSGDICRENATIVQEVTTRKLPAWRQLDNSVKRSKVLSFEKKIDLTYYWDKKSQREIEKYLLPTSLRFAHFSEKVSQIIFTQDF